MACNYGNITIPVGQCTWDLPCSAAIWPGDWTQQQFCENNTNNNANIFCCDCDSNIIYVTYLSWLGDGWHDNGQYGINFNCPSWGWDCDPHHMPPGGVTNHWCIPNSCQGKCGYISYWGGALADQYGMSGPGYCMCDDDCMAQGDCCSDYQQHCLPQPPPPRPGKFKKAKPVSSMVHRRGGRIRRRGGQTRRQSGGRVCNGPSTGIDEYGNNIC